MQHGVPNHTWDRLCLCSSNFGQKGHFLDNKGRSINGGEACGGKKKTKHVTNAISINQAFFFTAFPANWANGFAGILSYFDFGWVIFTKMLELFWSNMLELFCDKKTFIILTKMLEFFHIKMLFVSNFPTFFAKYQILLMKFK